MYAITFHSEDLNFPMNQLKKHPKKRQKKTRTATYRQNLTLKKDKKMEETLTKKKGESNCIYQHYKGKRLQENNKNREKTIEVA